MIARSRRVASLFGVCLLVFAIPAYAVSCLLFPLSCLKPKKKYGDEMEAVVLDLRTVRTDAYELRINTGEVVANPLQNTRAWYIWFKVGETLYQAERDETVLQMAYKRPLREDWVGRTVKLRFRDQKWMGIKSAWAVFDRGKGKEWEFVLISIVGPDGVDECAGRMMCPQQAEIDRAAREEEQLAKLKESGAKPAAEVEPMPVVMPEEPVVAAGVDAAAPVAEATPAAETAPAAANPDPADEAPAAEAAAAAETPPTGS